MSKPKVSCLMATYGRLTMVRRAVSCFLAQDYDNAELIILNNHAVPLTLDLPQGGDGTTSDPVNGKLVRVVNEPGHRTLGHCRNRLLDLARGEFVRTWDDDDLYLPWTLSQGVQHIGDAPAFKPKRSWFCDAMTRFVLVENAMEASMLVRAEVARKYRYRESGGDEHAPLLEGIKAEGGCLTHEFNHLASYVYTWGCGQWHISGSLGQGTIESRTAVWMAKNNDLGDCRIRPVDLRPCWRALTTYAEGFTEGAIAELRRRLEV